MPETTVTQDESDPIKDNIAAVIKALNSVVRSADFSAAEKATSKLILNRGAYGIVNDVTVINDLNTLNKLFSASGKNDYILVVTSLIDVLKQKPVTRSAMFQSPEKIRVNGHVYERVEPETPQFIRVSGQVFRKASVAETMEILAKKKPWGKLPKGWTMKSLKEFWESLGGKGKPSVTACIRKIKSKHSEIDDPGAFCASAARRLGEKVTRKKS